MSPDKRTLAVYDAKAEDYAALFHDAKEGKDLRAFIAGLPRGARVMDLGCGPGAASAHMMRAGLDPDPVDASPAMVALARSRFGLPARLARFDEIDTTATYDGVWANFSLLHAPRAELAQHLARLHRALKPGGRLHLGMKLGKGEGRDALGRFYAYYSEDELTEHLARAGFSVASRRTGTEKGLAGTNDPYIILIAHA
ncbi:class I SAM-dependent DNA methyltransferase [Salibaculum griseiflavum]|uniref:SAM-dependent methyltransferase n=1 Tax=Salibaculum griseiflavum TaxID=1914409 RepID=A0A2V1P9Z6_9RHOB|nr:class I SAM-dependent methyltransferase [Salibaculum griseiflavum]PWG18504.1 SAM-dependent methyltransferase [Salibaculum griseiflavum]